MREMSEFEKAMIIMQLKSMKIKVEQSIKSLEKADLSLSEYDLPNNVQTAFKMIQFGVMQIRAANDQMIQSTKAAIDALEKRRWRKQ